MTLKYHSSLLQDFLSMLTDANDCDVVIKVGENQNLKEFRAHSSILKVRSTYFKRGLSSDWAVKKDNNLIEFPKPNIDPTIFEIILKYIYTGEVNLANQTGADTFKLLIASDEMLFDELNEGVQVYLITDQSIWVQKNFARVLREVYNRPNCKKLIDHCVETFCGDSKRNFSSLDKEILHDLIQRDNFLIEEHIIWDCLIKWGIEQTPGLDGDRKKWDDKNYEALKETLNKYISFIRFSEISSADFFDKVLPFKAILPNGIYDEALEFYLKGTLPKTILPPRLGNVQIESSIINPKLAYMISNWIDNKDAKAIRNKNSSQFTFSLLYRKSLDGLDINVFRHKCKDQGPCLVLIRKDPKKTSQMWRNNLRNSTRTISRSLRRSASPPPQITQITTWSSPPPPPQITTWGSAPPPVASDSWHLNPGWNPDEDSVDASRKKNWDTEDTSSTKNLKIYGEYYRTQNEAENFVFSFENDNDTRNMKISRANHQYPNERFYGELYLSDCFHIDGSNVCSKKLPIYCDNNVIEPNTTFIPDEIEVFKVINKSLAGPAGPAGRNDYSVVNRFLREQVRSGVRSEPDWVTG